LVHALLEKYNFPADRLTLELTESAAIRDGLVSETLFKTLKSLGVRISIDDYGTGFSTLGYMKHIPSEEIKIDRSFVAALEKSHSDRLLVGSTIELAHSLGRKVVAEGVENELTAQLLQSLGCNALQGYLTGAPCEFSAFKSRYLGSQFRIAA
jgi:diguanylate cyclase